MEKVKRKIYLATSWRNEHFPTMLLALRAEGHEVYDFKTSGPEGKGFKWTDIGLVDTTSPIEFMNTISHPTANTHFSCDKQALDWCDTLVLLLPCGKDAHLECGYAAGQKKETFIFLSQHNFDAGLMYKLAYRWTNDVNTLIYWLNTPIYKKPEVKIKDDNE